MTDNRIALAETTNYVAVSPDGTSVTVTETTSHVITDAGRQGPPGPRGPQGPPGDSSTSLGYRHVQSVPAALVQVVHGLSFDPGGWTCVDTSNDIAHPERVTYPLSGVMEFLFGAPFSGVIQVS